MARINKKDMEAKKEYAQACFTRLGFNQKETALKVGVSEKTISLWVAKEGWDKLKAGNILSKDQELVRIYAQINELNDFIEAKEKGQRFANSKEADALKKLTSAAKDLENDLGISDTINVQIAFLNWLKPMDFDAAQLFKKYSDMYIKSLITK